MQGPLIFEHVPKCAGTTLVNILNNIYPLDRTLQVIPDQREGQIEQFARLDQAERLNFDLILGHGAYQFNQLLPSAARCFTFLRSPVDRVISNYYYILGQPDHHLYQRVAGANMGIKEYLTSGVTRTVNNYMTRAFSLTRLKELSADPQAALDKAVENLERDYFFVGLVEKFDLSLLVLKESLNWTGQPYYYRENVSGTGSQKREEIGQEIIEIIREKNLLDQQLYNYAAERFDQTLRTREKSLDAALEEFRTANQEYSRRKQPQKKLRDAIVNAKKNLGKR